MKKILFTLALLLSSVIGFAQTYSFQMTSEDSNNIEVKIDVSQKEVTILDGNAISEKFNYIYMFLDIPKDDDLENYEKIAKTKILLYTSKDSHPDTDVDDVTDGDYGNSCLLSIDGIATFTENEAKEEKTRVMKPVDKRNYITTFGKLELTLIGYK